MKRIAFLPPHDALVHAFVLAVDAADDERVAHSARLRELPPVLVPRDVLQPGRHAVAGDHAAELGGAAHVHAQDARHDVHLERGADRQPQLGARLAARVRRRALVRPGVLRRDRLDGQHRAQQSESGSVGDRERLDARVQKPPERARTQQYRINFQIRTNIT